MSVHATLDSQLDWADWAADSSSASFRSKVEAALDSARQHGRDIEAIDLHTVTSFVAVADDPGRLISSVAATTGLEPKVMQQSMMFLVGTFTQATEALLQRREETGINYYVFQPFQVNDERAFTLFAEKVLAPLATA